MNPYTIKRLLRRPWLSLCSLILTGAMCFLLCFLTGYLERQEKELEETKVSFEILCVVTTRDGTRATQLRMAPKYIGAVREDAALYPFIEDLRITKEFEYSCLDLEVTGKFMHGVSSERCADALNSSLGAQIVWFDEEGFFDREDMVCLISEEQYRVLYAARKEALEQREGLGETVSEEEWNAPYTLSCTIEDPYIDRTVIPELGYGQADLTVAGYYKGKGSDIYIPFPAAMALSLELSQRTTCDSIAFVASDNLRLEELAAAASANFGEVVPAGSVYADPPYALTIHDEQYRATLATLEQNIRRTQILLPMLLLLGFGMGFLISFLATRGEKRSYALMRTVGLTRGKLLFSILLEQTALPLLAALSIGFMLGNITPALMYLVCHCVGCTVVAVRAVRVPPTAILREQE